MSHRHLGLGAIVGDDHPLARGQTIGLDHDRSALPGGQHRQRPLLARGDLEARRGDAVPLHEGLGIDLGAFDFRRAPARSDDAPARGLEHVGDAERERRLGADHGEIHILLLREIEKRIQILGRDREVSALGFRGGARIARSQEHLGHAGAGGELPGDGVLAAAAADHEHL